MTQLSGNPAFSGEYITDLINWDSKEICLYSEDEAIFDRFRDDPHATRSKDYRRDGVYLGGDVWYLKSYKEALINKLKELGIPFYCSN